MLHIEYQSGFDPDLIRRMLRYNALLHEIKKIPVISVLILLSPAADNPIYSGLLHLHVNGILGSTTFAYQVIRVWHYSSESLLKGGRGNIPLALLANDAKKNPRKVVMKILQMTEGWPDRKSVLHRAFTLAGLRYNDGELKRVFDGVDTMVTWDEIYKQSSATKLMLTWAKEEAAAKGMAVGIAEGKAEGKAEAESAIVEKVRNALIAVGNTKFGAPTDFQLRRIRAIVELDAILEIYGRMNFASNWRELLAKKVQE